MVQLTKTVALLVLKKKSQYSVLGLCHGKQNLSSSCSILHRSSRRYCQSLNISFAFFFFLFLIRIAGILGLFKSVHLHTLLCGKNFYFAHTDLMLWNQKAVVETLPCCLYDFTLISLNFCRSLGGNISIQLQVSLNVRLKRLEVMRLEVLF